MCLPGRYIAAFKAAIGTGGKHTHLKGLRTAMGNFVSKEVKLLHKV